MFVEFVKHEAHAVHEAVHVRWLALVVRRALVSRKRGLERLEVLHPLDSEVVRLYVGLIEYQDERQLGLVQDTVGYAVQCDGFWREGGSTDLQA